MKFEPKKRTHFTNEDDELDYLNKQISYNWYHAYNKDKANEFCNRFQVILATRPEDDGSIMLQDHLGLLKEVMGDIPGALRHREEEILKIRRAFEIAGPIKHINYDFLLEKMQIANNLRIALNDSTYSMERRSED